MLIALQSKTQPTTLFSTFSLQLCVETLGIIALKSDGSSKTVIHMMMVKWITD